MKKITPSLGIGIVLAYFIACAPVKFEKMAGVNECQNFSQGCVNANGFDQFEYSLIIGGGQVDILFVDDNSGSMSFEHEQIAAKFPNFISQLDQRGLDYRIGIITTDISGSDNPPRDINENGALQNGNLVQFVDGSYFITPSTGNKEYVFAKTIERPETLKCDTFIKNAISAGTSRESATYINGYYENCPSGDERGIYSAYLALTENAKDFIRPKAHLSLVILSDENNRSKGLRDQTQKYSLEKEDLPETLVSLIDSKFQGDKTFTAHSIVVKNGDQSCLNAQNAQMNNYVSGAYGTEYQLLSQMTNGFTGSVCASEYGSQLGTIGSRIVDQVNTVQIACANPKNLDVQLNPEDSSNTWALDGKRIVFSKQLEAGSELRIKYSCPEL